MLKHLGGFAAIALTMHSGAVGAQVRPVHDIPLALATEPWQRRSLNARPRGFRSPPPWSIVLASCAPYSGVIMPGRTASIHRAGRPTPR